MRIWGTTESILNVETLVEIYFIEKQNSYIIGPYLQEINWKKDIASDWVCI
jgi:hypothetical protein